MPEILIMAFVLIAEVAIFIGIPLLWLLYEDEINFLIDSIEHNIHRIRRGLRRSFCAFLLRNDRRYTISKR